RVIGILHSCSASAEQVKEYVKMGWYISFSGVITFKNAAKTLDAVLATPKDRILVETDCPYLAPVPMRGKTNHSGYMHYTAAKAASLLQMDYEAFCAQEVQNAKTLLGIK
ncbi:MAG: TatD family hydrolase, partial [Clostridia bacterium]|nr:TatD family hydrolase [Clostridia bacterium]